jgi:P27 family predicted phage terminase small subunit
MPRPPKPTATLKLIGAYRADRHGDRLDAADTIDPLAIAPPPPASLSAAAAAVWRETVPVLVGMGLLTDADLLAFARYCTATVIWRRALEQADRADRIERSDVLTLDKADAMLRHLERSFGLTPASRSALKIDAAYKRVCEDKSRFFKP